MPFLNYLKIYFSESTSDLFVLSRAFGSNDGSKNWNPAADINKDGTVDGEDLILLLRNFGMKY